MRPLLLNTRKKYLYQQIAKEMIGYIQGGTWKQGDKIPSIRTICKLYGVSMSTALKAYYDLESKSFIDVKPQSGYYVCYSEKKLPELPCTSNPKTIAPVNSIDHVIEKVFKSMQNKDITRLSLGIPSPELLPVAKLNKAIVQSTRNLEGSGTAYDTVQGNGKLRRQIARRTIAWKGHLSEDDIITSSGCINAVAWSLMATTQKGDAIAVESPAYFGLLQLAQNLGLRILEMPTNPRSGIEIDHLKKAIVNNKVRACLLMPTFSNPLGSCMPDENKKELVSLLEHYQVPLIEDDLYGEIYFGDQRPRPCKAFDQSGNVLWCSSVSKTLAPGYRVGWMAPGKFMDKIVKIKLYHAMANTSLTQEAIGIFWETNRYDHHLLKMRQVLQQNCKQFIMAIQEHFPPNTKVSQPEGGFSLWVEFAMGIDTMELYQDALRQKISIAPGRIFTLQNQFNNCMRLSFGMPWDDKLDQSLKMLGKLSKKYL